MGLLGRLLGRRDPVQQVQEVESGGALRDAPAENELERVLLAMRAGTADPTAVVNALLQTRLFVPSPQDASAMRDGTGFKPLVADLPEGRFVPVFTSAARSEVMEEQGLRAASGIETEASWVVKNLPPELGIYINPGWCFSLMIQAHGVAQIRAQCDSHATNMQSP